jgi:hypothetical protein
MPSLADTQAAMREAVTAGLMQRLAPMLIGGAEPIARLAIHRRHYETSLAAAIREKFPASAWLAGAGAIIEAASAFVRSHPPERPCIAEYGAAFPAFLARHGRAADLPYIEAFAGLEWAVGQASIAVDCEAVTWPEIVQIGTEALLSAGLTFQPGVRYQRADWAIDELMTIYLGDSAADTFVLEPADTCIEVRGSRGGFWLNRVEPPTFAFRAALLDGQSIGDAAEAAVAGDSSFDAGHALAALVAAHLVIGVSTPAKGRDV